ncbi:Methylase-S domain-containing protein [Candidatus Ornithobacterium hominis]|uniref:restriction endonuclease subunit S n=1 Tax=Candidatus Ornithobacterium hominis TaxID=2497989 RepID=UPI0024BCC1E2|nr:restriction endonuclease subunit S [Candidatus Ornithobacterium hominis]CAI9429968.1 Methylase-S domain-containing protein [Candidatus Ornithobacterium hominis]
MSYKKLGEFIQVVDDRNKELLDLPLLGVSVQKVFIPSIANTVGTDMSKYKILSRNEFTYIPDTSRRGDKIGVALLKSYDKALVSQAYTTFKIIDKNQLLPDYLMMWFTRPEFDRYARYHSHGSTRESFDWVDMCNVELPVPSIEKQREIVAQYQAVANKIKINEQICEKLETTAQTLYKQWFVDFEFPNEEGKPYKSSGGAMVFNEELEKEIPEGWEVIKVKDFCDEMKNGATPSRDNLDYWSSRDIPWLKTGEISNNVVFDSEEYISKEGFQNSSTKLIPCDSVLMAMYGATAGQLAYLKKEVTTNQACCAMISSDKNKMSFLYYALLNQQNHIVTLANGGAQANLSKRIIEELNLILPQDKEIINLEKFSYLIEEKAIKTLENQKLTQLQSLLLSRLATLEG